MRGLKTMVVAGVGGVLATGVDVTVLLLLVWVAVPIALAAFVATALGAMVSFSFAKYVAFRERSPLGFDQIGRYAIVSLITALAMAGSMAVLVDHLGLAVFPAKLICATAVFVAWTYPAQRYLVFRRRPELTTV